MAKQTVCKKSTDLDLGAVHFAFQDVDADGEAIAPLIVSLESLPEQIVTNLALHGLSQKIGDSYSGVGGDAAEARKLSEGVLARLLEGDWRAAAVAGERKPLEVVEALFRYMERQGDAKTTEECEDVVGALQAADSAAKEATGKDAGKVRGLRKQLAEIIAEIRLEKAREKTDAAEGVGDLFA